MMEVHSAFDGVSCGGCPCCLCWPFSLFHPLEIFRTRSLAHFTFSSCRASEETFLLAFADMAAHVRQHEPGTLAYEALLNSRDPLKVLILERYRNMQRDYLQTHKSSAAFLEFRPKLKALEEAGHVKISGAGYEDTGLGFAQR